MFAYVCDDRHSVTQSVNEFSVFWRIFPRLCSFFVCAKNKTVNYHDSFIHTHAYLRAQFHAFPRMNRVSLALPLSFSFFLFHCSFSNHSTTKKKKKFNYKT